MRQAAFFLLLPFSLSAADQWIRLTTPHFELYTSAGEGKGREAILYFEQVRSFFLEASPSKHASEFPVRIIAFRGEKQYKPYRINEFATAFYTGSHERDYIVMGDISSEHYSEAIHEYTHLIIRHSGLNIPIWMNEGWAELYSTLRPMAGKARIGDMKPGWLHTLQTQKWLPLAVLTSADHKSPYYNERDKAGIFYAESWAMMHMLFFSDRYRPNFNNFVVALANRMSFPEACEKALGFPMPQVEKDLKSYFTMSRVYAATVNVKLSKSDEEPVVTPLGDFESQLVLADLLVVTNKVAQAKEALNALSAQNPKRPEVEESLGYLAWQNRDNDGARDHFAKAFAAGTTNPQVCFHYALMEHSDKSLDALRRAVNLKPDFTDAWMQLGTSLMNRQDYNGAIAAFNRIKKVTPQLASRLFSAKAYAFAKNGQMEDARQNAEDAKKWAKTPMDTDQANSILKYLDATAAAGKPRVPLATDDVRPTLARRAPMGEVPPPPPVAREQLSRVEGKAQRLDCNGKQARISILTDHGVMKFDIPDPDRVTVKHSSEATHDFACGPQSNYGITIEYLPKADVSGVDGIARVLTF